MFILDRRYMIMREIDYGHYFWQNDLVRLRALTEIDWEMEYYNRFDTPARLLLDYQVELPPTEQEAKEATNLFVNFNQSYGRIMFAIETLDHICVGAANMNSIDERNGTFSVGMQIDRDFRQRGYGTAAMKIIFNYAFLERRLNKYFGSTLENNVGSQTMLKKLGCKQEGIRKEMVYANGRYYDEILFGLTKAEYDSCCLNKR